jgi:hypothetical protein
VSGETLSVRKVPWLILKTEEYNILVMGIEICRQRLDEKKESIFLGM